MSKFPVETFNMPHNVYVPFVAGTYLYSAHSSYRSDAGFMMEPFEYTGWKDESMSWKRTCYIHNLSFLSKFHVQGPEAIKFFSDIAINGFSNFPVGTVKHIVMCNDSGHLMNHGVLKRLGEDNFFQYWGEPYGSYMFQRGNYKATAEDITESRNEKLDVSSISSGVRA